MANQEIGVPDARFSAAHGNANLPVGSFLQPSVDANQEIGVPDAWLLVRAPGNANLPVGSFFQPSVDANQEIGVPDALVALPAILDCYHPPLQFIAREFSHGGSIDVVARN